MLHVTLLSDSSAEITLRGGEPSTTSKSALFVITVMPQFVPGGPPSFAQWLTMAATSVSIATSIHLALVFGAERARSVLMAKDRALKVRRVLALAMLAVAAWFLAKAFL